MGDREGATNKLRNVLRIINSVRRNLEMYKKQIFFYGLLLFKTYQMIAF